MPKSKTPSFVHELPLKVSSAEAKVLGKRLEANRQLYNACLGEALRRLNLMRQSKIWQEARNTPKTIKDKRGKPKINKERKEAFKQAREQYGFSEYDLHEFAKIIRKACFIKDHIDSSTAQKTATRSFNAVEQYLYGVRGKPRFKSLGRMRSVEGKSNAAGIRWRDGKIEWKKLNLHPLSDKKDKHGVEAHALASTVKFVRLIRKTIRGKERWYAQLVLDGNPKQKAKNIIGTQTVGLDIGPSTVAIVGETNASLGVFAAELTNSDRDILKEQKKSCRKIERKIERSRRATNPDNYGPDFVIQNRGRIIKKKGKVKKGASNWVRSNNYRCLQTKLAEKKRVLAETRNRLHGELVNRIIKIGCEVKTEKLSYRAFQRRWGKSVGMRAPGMFISKLRRKAANAGGELIEFSTGKTKLSQVCHGCGEYVKKSLSQRVHLCGCGVGSVQRDLYSAFLARHVIEDCLDRHQAQKAWSGTEPLLGHALSRCNQVAIGGSRPASLGLSDLSQSGSHVKGKLAVGKPTDVVRVASLPRRAVEKQLSLKVC